jgi:hypothetical protein
MGLLKQTNVGCGGLVFGTIWIGFWSLIVLFFDGFLVVSAVHQLRALAWPDAPGEIVTSKVVESAGGEGKSYHADISYRYRAGGVERTGNTQDLGSISFGSQDARQTVARFPAGKTVRVFYNPRNPDSSILVRGLSVGHFFLAMFLIPFNLIMVGGWAVARDYFDPAPPNRLPRGAVLRRTYEGFQLKLYHISPLFVGATVAAGIAFIGTFVAGFGQMVLPAQWLVGGMWAVIVPSALCAYFRQRRRATRLEVNTLRNSVEVHPANSRRAAETILLDDLSDIDVRCHARYSSDGDRSEAFGVVLVERRKDGSRKRRMLVRGWSEKQARQLAGWLKLQLGLTESITA